MQTSGSAEFNCNGVDITLSIETEYPVDGHIRICVQASAPVYFTLKIRNPEWSDCPKGYRNYTKTWYNDIIEISFDMPLTFYRPEYWEEDLIYTDMSKNTPSHHSAEAMKVYHNDSDDHYIAVTKGPLTLAADSRTGKSAASAFPISRNWTVCENQIIDGVPCLLKLRFVDEKGEIFYLVDYASAGRDWETEIAAWLPTDI